LSLQDIKSSTYPFSVRTDSKESQFWVVDELSGKVLTKRTQKKELAAAYANQQKKLKIKLQEASS